LVGLDLFDGSRKIRERAVDDSNLVPRLERDARLRLHRALDDALAEIVDLRRRHFLRALVTDEARDLRRVLDEVPDVFAHLHLDEDVTGEARLLAHMRLTARACLRDSLGRDEHLSIAVLHLVFFDALKERFSDLVLVARVGLDDVPLLGHDASGPPVYEIGDETPELVHEGEEHGGDEGRPAPPPPMRPDSGMTISSRGSPMTGL